MVPDNSTGIPRAPAYSGTGLAISAGFAYGAVTRYGPPFQTVPLPACSPRRRPYNPGLRVATPPVWALPRSLAATGGIVVTFSSCGYLDVSVPRVGFHDIRGCRNRFRRVAPFGHPGIKGYLPLPPAFRSLSRPSSPPRAKASPIRPSSIPFYLHGRRVAFPRPRRLFRLLVSMPLPCRAPARRSL